MSPYLLVAADFVNTGGMDRANLALAGYLARRGNPTHLVTHRVEAGLGAEPGIEVHQVPRPLRSTFLGEPLLATTARLWDRRLRGRTIVNGGNCAIPDVNWVHYVHAGNPPQVGGPRLRRAQWQLKHRWYLTAERRAIGGARTVIANSERTRRDLLALGVRPERCHVVYYGVDPARFRPPSEAERREVRAELGAPASRVVFAFVGGLGDRRKGLDTLIEGFGALLEREGVDAELWVVGAGAELPRWRQLAAALPGGERIRFLGFRSDVDRLLRGCDVLVAPTRYEAYGLGVHEALCTGLPVIVSRTAGVAERLPPSLAALCLDDPGDSTELLGRLEVSCAQLPRLRDQTRAVSDALRARTWDQMAAEIVALAERAG